MPSFSRLYRKYPNYNRCNSKWLRKHTALGYVAKERSSAIRLSYALISSGKYYFIPIIVFINTLVFNRHHTDYHRSSLSSRLLVLFGDIFDTTISRPSLSITIIIHLFINQLLYEGHTGDLVTLPHDKINK